MNGGQGSFAAGLLDPGHPVPAGLAAWNGSDPSPRYAVYRNNVTLSLLNAVQDTFPMTCAWVGTAGFRELALRFVRALPPRSPILSTYGAAFPDFVAQSHLAWSMLGLADLARLEWLRVQSYHAADADVLSPAQLATVLEQPERLPDLRFTLHPAVGTLDSRYPVVSIWAAHQGLGSFDDIDFAAAQSVVIARSGLEVEVLHASAGMTHLVRLLGTGTPLGLAATAAAEAHPDFDLGASLAYLIRHRLLSAVTLPVEESRP